MALVRVVTMRTVGAARDPRIGGTTPAYRPATGLKPAMDAYAIPSGMLNSPVTMPAVASAPVGRPHRTRVVSLRARPARSVAIGPVRG